MCIEYACLREREEKEREKQVKYDEMLAKVVERLKLVEAKVK